MAEPPAGAGALSDTALASSTWAGRKVLVLSPTPTHPLDYGNRRRIFHLCRRLQRLGAEIHFLHYPTEEEWGRTLPQEDQRRMVAAWDAYYVAPVSRPLFRPPAADEHGIDEWWDPAIGQMLDWLFRVQSFDVFIVNYVWLSQAFAAAPPGVVKILDTHDRFSGRRALLEANGVAAEYFYTSAAEERIGLQRADIVWAIKPDEAAQFRLLCDRPVTTVLHAEPLLKSSSRPRAALLRFGIAGGDNSVNVANFRTFLGVAAAFVRRTLLPCEFVIAGSCCDLLTDLAYPFVRMLGRVATMDAFYDEVDVVLGPMAFSTGLKVRIGEALGRGKAIVAHAHCFDGYPATHAFHSLPSFEAMLLACRDIVRAPALIEDLETASVEALGRAWRSVERALETTLPRDPPAAPRFIVVVDPAELCEGSLVLDHVCEAALHVGHQCQVLFFLDGDTSVAQTRSVARLQPLGGLTLSQRAVARAGTTVIPALASAPVATLATLLRQPQHGVWFSTIPAALPPGPLPGLAVAPLTILAQRHAPAAIGRFLAQLADRFGDVMPTDLIGSPLLAEAWRQGLAGHAMPMLWRGDNSLVWRALHDAPGQSVTFLLAPLPAGLVELVWQVARQATARPIEFVYDDRAIAPEQVLGGDGAWRPPLPLIALSDYPRRLLHGGPAPWLVVELGYAPRFGLLAEVLDRFAIPRLSLFAPGAPRPSVAGRSPDRAAGVMESAVLLAETLADADRLERLRPRARARYGTAVDAGWMIMWDRVKRAVGRAAATAAAPDGRPVDADIVLHRQRDGDCWYAAEGWVGECGSRQRIEAFGIRPNTPLAPADVEYKAFGPNGRETAWVRGAALCGTRGRRLPLTGFAVRIAAHLRDRFDVVYEGSFFDSGPAGPARNGAPCVAGIADDPLEAMRIRLLERDAI